MEPGPTDRIRFARELVARTFRAYSRGDGGHFAAAIAYRVLFSLFPLTILAVGLFGLISEAFGVRGDAIDAIVEWIPLSDDGGDRLRETLTATTSGFGAVGVLGAVGLAWAASGMMAAIRTSLNRAWGVEQTRPLLRGKLVDLTLVLAVLLFFVLSFSATIAAAFAAGVAGSAWAPLGGIVDWLGGVAVPLVIAFGATTFVYHVVPASKPPLRTIWPAALIIALVYQAAQRLFALYLEHFASYDAVYGSLGAMMAFLVFVYLGASLLLLGAKLAVEWPGARAAARSPKPRRSGGEATLRERLVSSLRSLV